MLYLGAQMMNNMQQQVYDFNIGDLVVAKTKYNDVFLKCGMIIDIKNTSVSAKELFVVCTESGWSSWIKSEKCEVINESSVKNKDTLEQSVE